jgi:hypothetical protein
MKRGPPKKRKQPETVVAWNNEMTMTDDNLKAMSVPPERPAGQSSVVVPFPGGRGFHAYDCWCDACLASLVTRWKEFHPDETVVPNKRPTKPVVPFG